MICQEFVPQPQLRRFVQSYQLRHFLFLVTAVTFPSNLMLHVRNRRWHFSPRGSESEENSSYQDDDKAPTLGHYRTILTADQSSPERSGICVLLVNLEAQGVLYRLTGVPFTELTNAFVNAEDILPKETRRVNERLSSAESPQEMIGIIEKLLLDLTTKITKDGHPIDAVTNLLIQRPEDTSVLALAESSCFSPRQFERLFKERMGISPQALHTDRQNDKSIQY